MILSTILNTIGASIGAQVVTYLKDYQEASQFERLQGEVLEGWVYKLSIAIRDEHRRNNVPHEVHKKVMEKFNEVVAQEFDSTKL